MTPPRVAVVGCGYWGKNLVRNFAALGALELICDADPARLAAQAERVPGVRTTTDYTAVLSDAAVAGVVIATPAAHHFAHAEAALAAGKDVFVEKPLALHYAEGAQLVALAAEREAVLQVGHILEYHPAVTALVQLVRGGQLGALRYIYSHRLNLGKVRQEENILWSFAPHDIAVITRLVDAAPEAVGATGGSYLQPEIADVTVTNLRFAAGVRAHIFVSWLHPYKEQKLVVVGAEKMTVFDDTVPDGKLKLYDKGIEWQAGQPVPRDTAETTITVPATEPMRLECEDFLRAIRDRARPTADGHSGLRVLRVLEAAQRSLEADGQPVPLSAVGSDPGRDASADGAAGANSHAHSSEGTRDDAMSKAPVAERGYFAHPTAVIDDGAQIGAGSKVWHFCHVMPGARLGRDCVLGQNVFVAPEVTLGDGVKVQNNVSLYTGVTVEDEAFLGPSAVFTNVLNPRAAVERKDEFRATHVGRGASVGANATIVCGVRLGRYCFVGAGAVVTRDVPDFALVHGTPARVRGWVSRHGERLDFSAGDDVAHAEAEQAEAEHAHDGSTQDEATHDGGGEIARCPATGERYIKHGNAVRPIDEPPTED